MFTYKSLKMIYFHAHVHIELKGARERIGKCKKMGKTLEINCDLPAQYQSISDHGLHRAKACTITGKLHRLERCFLDWTN